MKIRPLALRTKIFEQNYSVREFADRVGVQRETIYSSLRNPKKRIRFDTLLKISGVLNCEPEDIAYIREYYRVEDDIEQEMKDHVE